MKIIQFVNFLKFRKKRQNQLLRILVYLKIMKSRRCFRLLLLTSMKIKNGNDHCSLQESDYILTYPITNNVSEIFFSEIFKVHFHRGFVIIVRDFANQVRRRCFSSVCMHPKSTFHRDFYNTMRRQYAQSVYSVPECTLCAYCLRIVL